MPRVLGLSVLVPRIARELLGSLVCGSQYGGRVMQQVVQLRTAEVIFGFLAQRIGGRLTTAPEVVLAAQPSVEGLEPSPAP